MKNPITPTLPQPALIDRFGRAVSYLRLSVTDKCDLRSTYCIPQGFTDFEESENWLTFDEIERVVGAFARMGAGRVRLTGGEPLLRRRLHGWYFDMSQCALLAYSERSDAFLPMVCPLSVRTAHLQSNDQPNHQAA
jgi:hypothetical protein